MEPGDRFNLISVGNPPSINNPGNMLFIWGYDIILAKAALESKKKNSNFV